MTDTELKRIKKMLKVILHLHLDGSLRPETIHEWIVDGSIKAETIYKWFGKQAKDVTLEEVKQALMLAKDWKGDLNEYLQKFDLPSQVLQTEEHIEQATFELFEDLSKQNVIYAEVRFAPSKHTENGLSYNQVVEAAIRGMNKAKEQYGIDGNLILCCMRGDNNTISNLQTVAVAKKYLDKGVCALDLAGAEALYPTQEFADIFKIAKEANIPFTIHAGEAARTRKYKKSN